MTRPALEPLEPRVLFSGVGELTDANVLDVADYGAVVDDGLDDRAAIQAAIDDADGRIVYLGDGVYDLSDSLVLDIQNSHLEGESRDGTILRAMSGFGGGSATTQDAVVEMQGPTSGPFGNGFRKTLDRLTVDVGHNNIDGINFFTNNNGGLNDVKVVDPFGVGDDGIALTIDNPGPGYNTDVVIEGFRFGIRVDGVLFGSVWEGLTIDGSRNTGIRNLNNQFTVRDLTLTGDFSRSAVQSSSQAQTTIIGADIRRAATTGGLGVVNFDVGGAEANTGDLYLRDVTLTGFDTAVDARAGTTQDLLVAGDPTHPLGVEVAEAFTGGPAASLFATPNASLNLPVRDAPAIDAGDPADWINVVDFGAVADDGLDDSQAFQAAIDAADAALGRTTVYLPTGTYELAETVVVRGDVRVINGLWSDLEITGPLRDDPGAAVFLVEGVDGPVRIEQIGTSGPDGGRQATFIEQADSDALVIRRVVKGISDEGQLLYRNTVEGELYVEDVTGNGWEFNGSNHRVWARQLNPENPEGVTKIVNHGATLWVLGLKTESNGTVLTTRDGGFSEVLGGVVYPTTGSVPPADQPAFINDESNVSVVISEQADRIGGTGAFATYATIVEETRGGVTQTLANLDAIPRGGGWIVNPYVGYTDAAPAILGDPPGDVEGFDAFVLNGTQVSLTWDLDGRDHDGFTLERRGLDTDVWTPLQTESDRGFTSFFDDTAVAGDTYLYRVRAFNDRGVSAYRFASVTTPTAPLDEQARYTLNDGGGSVVADASGNGNDAVTTNGPAFNTTGGVIDGALAFNGVDQRVSISDPDFFNDGFGQRTFALWVNPDTVSGNRILVDEGGFAGMALRILDGELQATARGQGVTAFTSADFSGRENLWTHVAVTFSNDTAQGMRLFIDGERVDFDDNTAFTVPDHANPGGIGGRNSVDTFQSSTGGFFDGEIDDVRVYTSALTDAQVAQLGNRLRLAAVGVDDAASVQRSGDVFTVDGDGKENNGFVFAYDRVSGDGSIAAQRLSGDSRKDAGIAYRESADADGFFVELVFESSSRVTLRYEDASGSGAVGLTIDPAVTDRVRLVRTGDSFEAQTSSDGVVWTTFATRTVVLAADLLAGLWSNGQDTEFDNLDILHA